MTCEILGYQSSVCVDDDEVLWKVICCLQVSGTRNLEETSGSPSHKDTETQRHRVIRLTT